MKKRKLNKKLQAVIVLNTAALTLILSGVTIEAFESLKNCIILIILLLAELASFAIMVNYCDSFIK